MVHLNSGYKEVDPGIWLVSFMDYDLGYIDLEGKTLQPLENPSGQKCNPCLRNVLYPCLRNGHGLDLMELVAGGGFEPPTFGL
jgi:hypothetical protein